MRLFTNEKACLKWLACLICMNSLWSGGSWFIATTKLLRNLKYNNHRKNAVQTSLHTKQRMIHLFWPVEALRQRLFPAKFSTEKTFLLENTFWGCCFFGIKIEFGNLSQLIQRQRGKRNIGKNTEEIRSGPFLYDVSLISFFVAIPYFDRYMWTKVITHRN